MLQYQMYIFLNILSSYKLVGFIREIKVIFGDRTTVEL